MFIVPLLSLFSFSVVAGAKTFSHPDLEGAVKQLPSDEHVIEIAATSDDRDQAGNDNNNQDGNGNGQNGSDAKDLSERFKRADHYVCSVTGSQLVRIQARYQTNRFSVDVRGRTLDIVAVYGAKQRDLRGYLGGPSVTCVLVRVSSVFFLPFDAHTS